MNKGFSLVELSIVLVIIGLVIGGVLVGQSMVQTTRIQMITKDLHQYEIAVNNFTQARKYYPGDDPRMDPAGSGNGIMDDTITGENTGMGSVPPDDPNNLGPIVRVQQNMVNPIRPHGPPESPNCNGNYSADETTQAYAQMSTLNMLPTVYAPYAPANCGGSQDSVYYNTGGANAPYNTVDNNVVSVLGSGPKLPFRGMKDDVRANYYIYFLASSKDVKGLESKLGAHDHYDNAVGLVNFDGAGQCDDGGSYYDCTDNSTPTKGSLGYFISGGSM